VGYSEHMTKEQLIDIVKRLLETGADLDYLSKLSKSDSLHGLKYRLFYGLSDGKCLVHNDCERLPGG